ncbi:MAG: hypothetical protein AB1611_00970 [bacterium]
MDKKLKSILIFICVWGLVAYPVFVGFACADSDGGPVTSGRNKASIFMNILSLEQTVTPEEIVPIPEVVQNMIENLPVDMETAEKIKDDIAAWTTRQRNRMTWWRAHTMIDY